MPLIFEKLTDTAKKIGVWEITEPESFFLEKLGIDSNPNISKKRQLEKICSAYLLNVLTGENFYNSLTNNENGKPIIVNSSYSVSFSHSKQMVACIVDKKGESVGIDIEEIRERILRLSHKFISDKDSCPFEGVKKAHLIWGAKEVLYKIYSLKELDFNTNLIIDYQADITGHINKPPHSSLHRLDFIEINNFMLVWNI